MQTRYLITLALLAACIRPEEGIDNTRIRGTVIAAPTVVEESDERQNGELSAAVDLDTLLYGVTQINGVVRDYHVNPDRTGDGGPTPPPDSGDTADTDATDTDATDTDATDTDATDTDATDTEDTDVDPYVEPLDEDADQDWYAFAVPQDVTMTIEVAFEGAEDTLVRVGLYDTATAPDEDGVYEAIISDDLSAASFDTGTGTYILELDLTEGTDYALRVAGLYGTNDEKSMAYSVKMTGLNPDDAGLLVGAFPPDENGDAPPPDDRGNPVAGTTVTGFELQSDDSYIASYEMYLVREVTTTPDPDTSDTENGAVTVANEAVEDVFLFAGDWSTLNQALPAGTWYSDEPVAMNVQSADVFTDTADDMAYEYIEAPDLTVNAVAPLVIGYIFEDTEPNDMVVDVASFTLDVTDPTLAQDVGAISVEGFVDFFNGTIPFKTADSGFVHDSDVYKFTVEQYSTIYFEMAWDDGADLDIIIFDGNGDYMDFAASLENPEISGGYSELIVGESYFLAVLGYASEAGATSTYEVKVEPVGL